MFKKVFSVLLIICVSFSFCNVALMAEPQSSETGISDIDNMLPEVVKGNDVYSQKEYKINTKYEGIKQSADGYYAMTIETKNGQESIPVGKLDIDLSNKNSIKKVLNDNNIPQEIKDRIQERNKQAVNAGCKTAKATLFSPDLLPAPVNSTSEYSTRSTSYTTLTYYNGAQMKNYQVVYTGLNTGTKRIASGTTAHDIADMLGNILMVSLSSNVVVNFLSSGISIFDAFCNAFGTWATGQTSDYVEMSLIYNNTDQWTYRKVNNQWLCGLCSQKATVTNIASTQYYYNSNTNTGQTYPTSRGTSVSHVSPHFSSPYPTAYNNCYNFVDEWVKWRCGSVTFMF